MSSSSVIIYDGAGVDSTCIRATNSQINSVIDGRSFRVEHYSRNPGCLDNPSNPIRLFVIPGGNYVSMEEELKSIAPLICKRVLEGGTSYLGICAGAIAAVSQPILCSQDKLIPDSKEPSILTMCDTGYERHLKLYDGHCCVFLGRNDFDGGIETVKKVADTEENEPYDLFFMRGVFFPGAVRAKTHLEYSSYSYKASMMFSPSEQFGGIPAAAVVQEAGKGRVLLTGLHSEISAYFVQSFESDAKISPETILKLKKSRVAQQETMRSYLKILGINTINP